MPQVEIIRPKDLPLASSVADDDAIIIDQGAAGVKQTNLGQIRTQMQSGVFAVGLSATDTGPEGVIAGRPPYLHFEIVDGAVIRVWYKATGVDTDTGWKVLIGPPA